MKRVLIGGFLSLTGMMGFAALLLLAAGNLANGWSTPPGRLVYTLLELDAMPYFVISILLVILGIVLMGIEYFRKDK